MGALVRAEPIMAHVDLTTESPPVARPPFEVSSLINRIEGPSVSVTLKYPFFEFFITSITQNLVHIFTRLQNIRN